MLGSIVGTGQMTLWTPPAFCISVGIPVQPQAVLIMQHTKPSPRFCCTQNKGRPQDVTLGAMK